MSIQETSIEAFITIKKNLHRSQKEVFDALQTQPNATNLEIAWMLKWPINRVTPRCVELRELGLVEEFGKRICRVSKRRSIAWRAVPMPSAVERAPEPKKDSTAAQQLFQ
jgi:hypothetical protein